MAPSQREGSLCWILSQLQVQFQPLICILSVPPPYPGAFPETTSFWKWDPLALSLAS